MESGYILSVLLLVMISHLLANRSSYRYVERSRKTAEFQTVRRLLQRLSRGIRIKRIGRNIIYCCIFLICCLPVALFTVVIKIVWRLLSTLLEKRDINVSFSVPSNRRTLQDNAVSLVLCQSPVDTVQLRQKTQIFLQANKVFSRKVDTTLGGWLELWTSVAEVDLNNHIVELPPTWKHQLLNESILDEYVTHVSTLPFMDRGSPPWQIFICPLHAEQNITGACVLIRSHRKLLAPLLKLLMSETMEQKEVLQSLGVSQTMSNTVEYAVLEILMRLDDILGITLWNSGQLNAALLNSFSCIWKILRRIVEVAQRGRKTGCKAASIYFNLPRMTLEKLWYLLTEVAPCGPLPSCKATNITWTSTIPLEFLDTLCTAINATREEVILSTISTAVSEYLKYLGGISHFILKLNDTINVRCKIGKSMPDCVSLQLLPPLDLSTSGSCNSSPQLDLLLPCSHSNQTKTTIETIRRHLGYLEHYERQPREILEAMDAIKRCISWVPWKWACQEFAAMETTSHCTSSSALLDTKLMLTWGSAGGQWPLHLCLSVLEREIGLGIVSNQLPCSDLRLVARHFERRIYQIASENGVQYHRLSPYSSPDTTPKCSPIQSPGSTHYASNPPFAFPLEG